MAKATRMDASPILPVKANQQFAPPVGASGLSAVFQALLQESELRLEARSALPTRGPTHDTPNAEPVARHLADPIEFRGGLDVDGANVLAQREHQLVA